MAVETEIKLRLPQGAARARSLIEQHGFVLVKNWNTLYVRSLDFFDRYLKPR